jgi:hypothetical protein
MNQSLFTDLRLSSPTELAKCVLCSFDVKPYCKQRLPASPREMLCSSCLGGSTSSVICKTSRRRYLDPKPQFHGTGPMKKFDEYVLSLADLIALGLSYRSTVRLLSKSPNKKALKRVSRSKNKCKGKVLIVDYVLNFNRLSPLTYIWEG